MELEAEGVAAFHLSGTRANTFVLLLCLLVQLLVLDLFHVFTHELENSRTSCGSGCTRNYEKEKKRKERSTIGKETAEFCTY